MTTEARTVSGLVEDLRRLGVGPGRLVMVHASLRAIGPVEGGAEGIVEALDLALSPGGTALMLLGAHGESWLEGWTGAEGAEPPEPPERAVPFDPRTSRADPEIGALAEVFRQVPGTLVSDHPEARFGARGAGAAELVEGVPWDDYFGPGSPLERLVEAGGSVLRLGSNLDTMTLLHYAEYLVAIPDKRRVRRHYLVHGPDGPVVRAVGALDDAAGIVDYEGEDYFARITRAYLAERRPPTGRVGRATSELVDAADLVDFGVAWMAEQLR